MPLPSALDLLSARQRDVYDYVSEYVEDAGYPPTVTEIARSLGIVSRGSVHSHLLALVRKGFLEKRYFRGYWTYWPVDA